MGTLIYTAITSLDGYIEDVDGRFDWSVPRRRGPRLRQRARAHDRDPPLRPSDVRDDGRVETVEAVPDVDPVEVEYAELWRDLDKVVFSTTLEDVWTARTRLERSFDAAAVRRLKEGAVADLSVSGPALATHAFAAGLVDEVHLLVNPILVGAGTPGLPAGVRVELELVDEHRFSNGVVHLHHRVRR